jgi:hypothetical protein
MSAAQATRDLRYGFALSVTPNMAEAFSSDQICPHRLAVGFSMRASARLTSVIQLEAHGEAFAGPSNSCVSATVPPRPETGSFSSSQDFYEERVTGPPALVSVRLGALLPSSSIVSVRPYIGAAYLAGKAITMPVAGVTLNVGRGEHRFLLETEGWFLSVPKQHLEEQYLDGRLVQRTLAAQDIQTFTTVLRLGLTSPLGRQSPHR